MPSSIRPRLNSGLWAIVLLVVIELLTNVVAFTLAIFRVATTFRPLAENPVYRIWLAAISLLLLAAVVLWLLDDTRRLRLVIFVVNGIFTAQLFLASTAILVRLAQQIELPVSALIVDALVVFITNILIFSLWYWFIDSSDTKLFRPSDEPSWDFLFPQRAMAIPGAAEWKPHFVDYLFVAFTTSVAFSPTDTPPLTRAAKLLTVAQSAISLIAIVAIAGTAVNILASSNSS
ncbi:MAG TPA: hypothetical protein VJ160_07575 [Anaerolineales bacterium]|nr:hypothetical protein [Anaerolineales bacterium]